MDNITYSITGGIEAISIDVFESYEQPSSRCTIVTPNYGSLGLGDLITVNIGFDSSNGTVFQGYIQDIAADRLPGQYTIEAQDVLIKAVEHLIVSTDLDNPWSRTNISAEDLIEDLLNEAGIISFSGASPGFTFATGEMPVEFQLIFAWDAIKMVSDVVAWHVYADTSGTVHFADIDPTPSGAPVASYVTGSSGTILTAHRSRNTDNLRNKVVVFGIPPVAAVSSASSPYLPAGFYKTAVISSHLIDTQAMADTTASYNLSKWNKLTETCSLETIGQYQRHARQTVTVTESFSGASGDFFIHDITHSLTNTYIMRLNLTK